MSISGYLGTPQLDRDLRRLFWCSSGGGHVYYIDLPTTDQPVDESLANTLITRGPVVDTIAIDYQRQLVLVHHKSNDIIRVRYDGTNEGAVTPCDVSYAMTVDMDSQ